MTRFSKRHGHSPTAPPIKIREGAPQDVRDLLADLAYRHGSDPHSLRSIVCRVLLVAEDQGNWSAFPNVDLEVRGHLGSCEWYYFYDIVEEITESLVADAERGTPEADPEGFEASVNELFVRHGVGWRLSDGTIEMRGEVDFELVVPDAEDRLEESGRPTAARELREALSDLSRRPTPDVTGAIQHALAALECLVRDVAGDPNATLGALLKSNPDLLPQPINDALRKLWGFASEQGRHLREGREPNFEDAELAVHVSAAVARYLVARDGGVGE